MEIKEVIKILNELKTEDFINYDNKYYYQAIETAIELLYEMAQK